MIRSIWIIGLIFSCIALHAQSRGEKTEEQLKIHFRFDKDVFEREYMDNEAAISSIERIFKSNQRLDHIDSLTVVAFASPEGSRRYNEKLAKRRAEGIKRYLLWQYPALDSVVIHTYSKGEDWDGLKAMVAADSQMPHREVALTLLSEADPILREQQLRAHNSGKTWGYIESHFLHKLRVGATFLVHYNPEKMKALSAIATDPQQACLPIAPAIFTPVTLSPVSPVVQLPEARKPLFAVKSNLLADLATSINIEVEVPIGERWSAGAEWLFPWWVFDKSKYYNQLLLGTLEGRYWFRTRKQTEILTGHAAGLYVSAGYFDLQWRKNGYQGEILPSVGLSYTYAHKIGRSFRMEYSFGLGVMNIHYRKYTANDAYNQFPWLSSGRTLWVGPSKAEVSLVWLISKRVKNEKQ